MAGPITRGLAALLTPAQRAAIEECRANQTKEQRERLACPSCNTEMRYVSTLNPGNSQGWGAEYLFQCPACKLIDTRDRT